MSESCEEYADAHRHEIRTARKQHTCSACGRAVNRGDRYAFVAVVGNGTVYTYKRCGACEVTWRHLLELCRKHNAQNRYDNLYPLEDLSCGLSYTDEWGDLPEEIATLAFVSDAEAGRLLP